MNRRTWLFGVGTTLVGARMSRASARAREPPFTAQGERIGDVTPTSALVHVRLTAEERRRTGFVFEEARPHMSPPAVRALPPGVGIPDLDGAVPGQAGRARVVYATDPGFERAQRTQWAVVGRATDFTHLFSLADLTPATEYHFCVETLALDARSSAPPRKSPAGRFRTAPDPRTFAPITFAATTCQKYAVRDHDEGYRMYRALRALAPDFVAMNGDNVYYDLEPPRGSTRPLALHHWHRIYSLPSVVDAYRNIPAYWLKDDHDILQNDCWPGMASGRMAPLTFEQGRRIFRTMVPQPARPYRSARWGKALEVWFLEGRDHRSPNNAPNGPDKTIWGRAQRDWLMRTLRASRATFKVIVTPTPIVGPDRPRKTDNHANETFGHEGAAFRRWLRDERQDVVIVTGDRHWQYHSVDPDTGLHELCSGPVSDELGGGSPGETPKYHRFHLSKGGFLSGFIGGDLAGPELTLRLHNPGGGVRYEYRRRVTLAQR